MGEHTPTPWSFSPWHIEEGPPAVRAPAGHVVATTASDDDAAFIVEAVNSYEQSHQTIEALVGALEKCQSALATIVDPKAIQTTTVMNAWSQAVEAETNARSALLLAQGSKGDE